MVYKIEFKVPFVLLYELISRFSSTAKHFKIENKYSKAQQVKIEFLQGGLMVSAKPSLSHQNIATFLGFDFKK